MAESIGKEYFIVCRNSQGIEFRGTLLRLTRYTVVFEVYNPYSILQLTEVLTEFRIIMNDRMVYSGRAVVSNLLNTGILLVCECMLEENWLDVNLFASAHPREKLQEEFSEFLKEWEKISQVSEDVKVVVSDLQGFLMGMRRWLEQVELSIRSDPSRNRLDMEREAILDLKDPVSPVVESLFGRFEKISAKIPEELKPIHRAYIKRQLHPLVLCSPFVYRVYYKPLGYAGDYEMINMILRDPFEGSSLFAKLLNLWFLSVPPCIAHRNRIDYLKKAIREETKRAALNNRPVRILNMGCGPAREVQDFFVEDDICEMAEFTLMDFNDETLEYTSKTLERLKSKYNRKTKVKMVKKSVHEILKESFKINKSNPPENNFDFIYCAGLFDYLEDRICKKLMDYFYSFLSPGGLLLATNVTPSNPARHVMENILEWPMIYRNHDQMMSIKPEDASETTLSLQTEPTGVNIVLEVRKS